MKIVRKIFSKITNGIILIIISLFHNQLAISNEGFGSQFGQFAKSNFFKVSEGMEELPAMVGKTNFEAFAAFWFFYFGLLLIPLGILLHHIERNEKLIPFSFSISYLVLVLIGVYMIPNSGMTFIMLPHAIYMLFHNYIIGKINKRNLEIKYSNANR